MGDKTMFVAGGSQRSGMVMFHNNFRFVRHKSLNDDVMRWTCAGRRKWGCKAFVKTSGSEVIDAREDHTHDLHNASVAEDMPRSAKQDQYCDEKDMKMEIKTEHEEEPSETDDDSNFTAPTIYVDEYGMCVDGARNSSNVEMRNSSVEEQRYFVVPEYGNGKDSRSENGEIENYRRRRTQRAEKVKRSSNFTEEERQCLIRLALARKNAILNNRTDGYSTRVKNRAWAEIQAAYNSSGVGPPRDAGCLRMKLSAIRREIRLFDQQLRASKGEPSERPVRPLTEEEIALRDVMRHGLMGRNSLSDSDGGSSYDVPPGLEQRETSKDLVMNFSNVTSRLQEKHPASERVNGCSETATPLNGNPSPATVPTVCTVTTDVAAFAAPNRTPTADTTFQRRPTLKRKMTSAADFERIAKLRMAVLEKKNRLYEMHLSRAAILRQTATIERDVAAMEKERTMVLLEIAKKQLKSIE
ncbi:Hypothetical protein NTJ_14894 [Nesidiocoris tenuis]|uniref:Regulatory protein zeste n=1 Tax=Nesidiocoris tenuis TaxID=355587 RepID=A0ABN7BFW6_9HEMI|nr:Hypothetical protein NTJ_14894 [Nesidiocoris tenuis]